MNIQNFAVGLALARGQDLDVAEQNRVALATAVAGLPIGAVLAQQLGRESAPAAATTAPAPLGEVVGEKLTDAADSLTNAINAVDRLAQSAARCAEYVEKAATYLVRAWRQRGARASDTVQSGG